MIDKIMLDYFFFSSGKMLKGYNQIYDNTITIVERGVPIQGLYLFNYIESPVVLRKTKKLEELGITEPGKLICDVIHFDIKNPKGLKARDSFRHQMSIYNNCLDFVKFGTKVWPIMIYEPSFALFVNKRGFIPDGDWAAFKEKSDTWKELEKQKLIEEASNFMS